MTFIFPVSHFQLGLVCHFMQMMHNVIFHYNNLNLNKGAEYLIHHYRMEMNINL